MFYILLIFFAQICAEIEIVQFASALETNTIVEHLTLNRKRMSVFVRRTFMGAVF